MKRPPPTPADLIRLRDRVSHRIWREYDADGGTKYTALKPCRKGHLPIRYVTNGACVECSLERAGRQSWRVKNAARDRKRQNARTTQDAPTQGATNAKGTERRVRPH